MHANRRRELRNPNLDARTHRAVPESEADQAIVARVADDHAAVVVARHALGQAETASRVVGVHRGQEREPRAFGGDESQGTGQQGSRDQDDRREHLHRLTS